MHQLLRLTSLVMAQSLVLAASPTPGRATDGDTDNDGMPDGWETANGLNPSSDADAQEDPDGDQIDNLSEYLAGTDPWDPNSVFRILAVEPGPTMTRLIFQGGPSRSYLVQACGCLALPDWRDVTNVTTSAAGGPTEVMLPLANPRTHFFRVTTRTSP
jgi:hypothetical protein